MSVESEIQDIVKAKLSAAFVTPVRVWCDNIDDEDTLQAIVYAETAIDARDEAGEPIALNVRLEVVSRSHVDDDKSASTIEELHTNVLTVLEALTVNDFSTLSDWNVDAIYGETSEQKLDERYHMRTAAISIITQRK